MDELISDLEKLNNVSPEVVKTSNGQTKKVAGDMKYSELPPQMYQPLGKAVSEWDLNNDYAILSTDKWRVPMPRPPVCINNAPCKVCPTNTSGYPLSVKQWDDSRRVTSGNDINKTWAIDTTTKPPKKE